MKQVFLGLGIAVAIMAFTPNADAQIMSNPSQWYVNNQMYSMRVFNGMVANSMLNKRVKGGGAAGAGSKATPSVKANATTFKESADSPLLKTLARKANGQNTADTEKALRSLIALYKETARKDGYASNDLAYALEYYVVNNYHIYHDLLDLPADKDPRIRRGKDSLERVELIERKRQEQITPLQERAVYNQFKAMLNENPEVRKMTDAQKQEATELLAVMFGMNLARYMQGINAGDDTVAADARRMAKEGLEKLLGAPISSIRINESGLQT